MADEKFSNFLTEIIDADLAEGKVKEIHTRFPPEPNGYLHIGSAKAIYINYMTAKTYGGKFNLRFDDTNPAREGDEYVQSILKDLEWLGATPNGGIFYGSDYFEKCYEYAEKLIQEGKPEHPLEKILPGKLKALYAQSCLLNQGFVKDPSVSVDALLKQVGKELGDEISVVSFVRYQLGA